jgi:hypothetical protein
MRWAAIGGRHQSRSGGWEHERVFFLRALRERTQVEKRQCVHKYIYTLHMPRTAGRVASRASSSTTQNRKTHIHAHADATPGFYVDVGRKGAVLGLRLDGCGFQYLLSFGGGRSRAGTPTAV